MSRLTERETSLILRARQTARDQRDWTDIVVEARHLQSEAFGRFIASAARAVARWTGLAALYHAVAVPLRRALERRRTVAELRRLDHRMLRDIGLEPYMVEDFADGLTEQNAKPQRRPEGLLAKLRRWQLRQRTIRELEAQSDRTLEDIGLTRGQIKAVTERALAEAEAPQDEAPKVETTFGDSASRGTAWNLPRKAATEIGRIAADHIVDAGYVREVMRPTPKQMAQRSRNQTAARQAW